jgi:hypothetical protein
VVPSADGFQITEAMFRVQLVPVGQINRSAPPELCDLIHRCLNYNAHKRPERVSEVQGILDRLADEAADETDTGEMEE